MKDTSGVLHTLQEIKADKKLVQKPKSNNLKTKINEVLNND